MRFTSVITVLLFLFAPNMTSAIDKIIDAKEYFTVDQNQAAFLSFALPQSAIADISESERIVLSLFLESTSSENDTAKFVIYPVDRLSRGIGNIGLLVEVSIQRGEFVDFVIPPKIFEEIQNPAGFIIAAQENTSYTFKGPDTVGTTIDPRLVIEEREEENISQEQFPISAELKSQLDRIEESVKKSWWENSLIQLVMLVGAIAGIVSLAVFFLKK